MKYLKFYILLATMVLLFATVTSNAGIIGDTNGDGIVDIAEALYALQVSSGLHPNLPDSCAITGHGDWVTETAYNICDVVKHEGSYFICTQAHTSEQTNSPNNSSFWTPLSFQPKPKIVKANGVEIGEFLSMDWNYIYVRSNMGYIFTIHKAGFKIGENCSLVFESDNCTGQAYCSQFEYVNVLSMYRQGTELYYSEPGAVPVRVDAKSLRDRNDWSCDPTDTTYYNVLPMYPNDPAITGVTTDTFQPPITIE